MGERKEYTTVKSLFGIPGTDYHETVVYDTGTGHRATGVGNTKEKSIENAYKNWREKYK